jgi:hypothetical protein
VARSFNRFRFLRTGTVHKTKHWGAKALGAPRSLARRHHVDFRVAVRVTRAVGVVDAVCRIRVAVAPVGVRRGVCVVRVAAQPPAIVAVLVVELGRIRGVRIAPGLVAVGAAVRAVGIVQPVGLVRVARAVGVVEAVGIVGAGGVGEWGEGEANRLWCYRVEVRETQSNMAFREGHREWNEDLFA